MQNLIGSGEEDQIYGGKKKVCLATLPALLTGKFKKKKILLNYLCPKTPGLPNGSDTDIGALSRSWDPSAV